MNKKILILYTSVGLGHKFIAQNIGYHLERAGFQVQLHDILQVQEGAMTGFGVWLHSFINRRLPFIWRWLYFSELVNLLAIPLRVPLAKTNSENLLQIVKDFGPDCILSTQTTGSAATAALIQQQKFLGKFLIAFSDYHLHKFWLYDEADLYLANTVEQKQEMIALGVSEAKIAVCGITLKPMISTDLAVLRAKLNLSSTDRIVVFGSGSLGIGFDFTLLKKFLTQIVSKEPSLTVLVLCGKNQHLKQQLDQLALPKILPLGFYDNPSELYQLADLLVTKPGGLTIAEALQANCPILITHTLPGQEEPNYDYLLARGLVIAKPEPLTAETLTTTAIKVLSSTKPSRSTDSQKITQSGHEGEILISWVKNLFHNV
jgi:processive 1,2-diacylglycerol beta-glucosyltransferase